MDFSQQKLAFLSSKLQVFSKRFKTFSKKVYTKVFPLYLRRALSYLQDVFKLTLYDWKYKNPKYRREILAKSLNEFDNFTTFKNTESHYKRFCTLYHIANGRAHDFIYDRQKSLHSIEELSSELEDKIVSLIKLAYKKGKVTSELDKRDLINLKQEYHTNGYIVLPFRLSSLEVRSFISKSKSSNYTLFARQDGVPPQAKLPDDPLCAKAKLYSRLEISEDESAYPKDIEAIIFLICHYFLDLSRLEVVSNEFSYSFYQQSTWQLGYDAAQNWHWDLDAIEFIKAFTYFTNVSESDGPHQACLGTHKQKPLLLRSFYPYRVPHFIIKSVYNITSFELMAGSIILGNTKCLHRGLPLSTKGSHRLMHQFYLTNPPGSFYYDRDKNYKSSQI